MYTGRRHWLPASLIVLALAAAGLAIASGTTSSAATSPCGRTTTRPSHYKHVVVIVMENKTYSQVIGNAAAPYLTGLAHQCASDTKYASVSSPSRPNYIGMTSGIVPAGCAGSDADPPSCTTTANNVFRQVISTGARAKSYVESMTSKCQIASSGSYATKHNPWPYYIGTNDRTWCGTYDIPLGSSTSGALVSDITNGALPRLAYVVPNLCNDTHNCGVATGDAWLKTVIGKILAGPNYAAGDTAVIVTYDEYTSLPNVWISPSVKAGTVSATAINHYALLRTVEEMIGVPLLGNAATAPSMRATFNL
jgi:phospholipase C